MKEECAFFVARAGAIWACFLDGRPAVKLGGEDEFWQAVSLFYDERNPHSETVSATHTPPPPPPTPAPEPESAEPDPDEPGQPRTVNERSAERHAVSIVGRIFTSGGSREAIVGDLSSTGCRFEDYSDRRIEKGAHLTVKIGTVGPIPATVRWNRSPIVGVQFDAPLHPSVLEHIRLQFGRAK
ncbi:PilZ domain-containing protein [Tsuneonella sp. YG55]|uniref:PilZ domain-containing protein n=1 Tax=Tsuneonella litorea TaxID=2976475 RepID=A0A9X2W3P5_9SPHN|nr:PilZ domain-containing protein [Tsuneonella litorea]MCT2559405.1 PilZ domain-containing protein [Tsuneonella litorea]